MFYIYGTTPGEPTPIKQLVYLTMTVVLFLMLSMIVHALLEIVYLKLIMETNAELHFSEGGCALPHWLQALLWIVGSFGGFFVGRYWWRYVYVDRTWATGRKTS